MDDFTPTTEVVENSYAYDPEYEYHNPDDAGYHHRNRAAFRRWLKEHDREIAEKAFDKACDMFFDISSTRKLMKTTNPYRKETQ